MWRFVWKAARAFVAILALASLGVLANAPPALAQIGPLTACDALTAGDFNFVATMTGGPFSRTQQYQLPAFATITIRWTNVTNFSFKINGAPVVFAPGTSGVQLFVVPADGLYTFEKTLNVPSLPASVTVECTPPAALPPPAGPADETARNVDGALGDQLTEELNRIPGALTGFEFLALLFYGNELTAAPPLTLDDPCAPSGDDEDDPEELGDGECRLYYPHPLTSSTALRAINSFVPRSEPLLPTMSFVPSGDGFSGLVPLGRTWDNWVFAVKVDAAFIDRSFAAVSRQTRVGSATLMAAHPLSDDTTIGLGLKLGAANTTGTGPALTLNSGQIGADLAIVKILSPTLTLTGYAGYELGLHTATVSGVSGSFASHTLKAGGRLKGNFELDRFLVSPAASALLMHTYRPSYVDASATTIPASSATRIDASAGVTVSTDLDPLANRVVVSPFVTGNLMFGWGVNSLDAVVAPSIPNDPLRAQLIAGLRLAFENGAMASVSGNVSRGANTIGYGVGADLTMPIK
jgi:hypothetical protein